MKNVSKTTCFDIAIYFINTANATGSLITNLKLQKMTYFAQAWYLGLYGKPLFPEDFQAWIHGPAIPELYRKYKKYLYNPISLNQESEIIQPKIISFLNKISNEYMPYDAYALELMTHQETPWQTARGSCAPDENCETIISKELIKDFYARKI